MIDKIDDQTIIAYAHNGCPMWYPVRGMLQQADVDFEYINIHLDLAARERVKDINNGYESVPTLVFPDGSTLTEPSASELRKKLQALGYEVPVQALLIGNAGKLLIAAGILLALLRLLGVF